MSILTVKDLGKYYGAQDVFAGITASLARGDKVALVGPNGAGKTTLVRIMLGLDSASAGQVERARGLRIGYLPQRPALESERTLHEEMLAVFAELRAQQQALHALAHQLAEAPQSEALMQRYADAEQRFELQGGYDYEQRIRRVLGGLGFGPETYDWPIGLLSGGQVTRALLARLLLESPELLVLDEPTNYLDLAALEWLESYLASWPHSLLVISHDRYFLDRVVNRVWDLNHGQLATYRGNYSRYVAQREDRQLGQQRAYEAQQAEIAKTEGFIRRYHAGQRSKEARGRQTRLDRVERLEAPKTDQQIRLRLHTDLRSGDQVISSAGARIGYRARPEAVGASVQTPAEFPLFDTGEFLIQRGDRVALLGANGSGKTTFLRTLLGQIKPLAGSVRLGASVRIGYLPQKQDWLDPALTVLEQIMAASDLLEQEARTFLGRFLFSGDDAFKPTGALSGGEQARVALAILAVQGANLLVLDEPTTHLDVASQEVLQEVLTDFPGTILLVSHDRYLMDALATHVYWIADGRLHTLEGNYSTYAQYRRQMVANEALEAAPANQEREEARRQQRREEQRARRLGERLESLEEEIDRTERELAGMAGMIERASVAQDVGRLHALGAAYSRLEATLRQSLSAWEELAGRAHDGG
ncbi:MAG: ABC-F family ATP-binding cassette domain-containing protein [Chloroflexota bacterium]